MAEQWHLNLLNECHCGPHRLDALGTPVHMPNSPGTRENDRSYPPTSTPKCNAGHSRSGGVARAEGMAGRRGFRPPGGRGSSPGTAVVPSVWSLSGLSGRRNATAGAGRVRPGAARPEPGRTRRRNPVHPFLRAGGRRSRGVREGGPHAAPRRASGSPAPGADARPCGPAPPSPARR